MILKIYTMQIFKTNFAKLTNDMDLFWSFDKGDAAFQISSKRLLKQVELSSKLFCMCFAVTATIFISSAFYLNELMFVVWVPDYGFLNRRFVIYLQIAYLISAYFSVLGFDLFFISACVNLILQFDLVASAIRRMDVKDEHKYENLKKIIQYHSELLQ